MQGYIYFITNPAMPGLLKIGFTKTSLAQRLRELDTTGIPDGFIVAASFLVSDPEACERAIHERLTEFRARSNREFFRITPNEALSRTADLLSAHLANSAANPTNSRSATLDDFDEQILQHIIHRKGAQIWPQKLAWEFEIHREEAHLRLGELAAKGYLRDDHEWYSLTHKGRKYLFDRGLVIPELLPEPE